MNRVPWNNRTGSFAPSFYPFLFAFDFKERAREYTRRLERRADCLVPRFSLVHGTLSCRKTKLLVEERYKIAKGFGTRESWEEKSMSLTLRTSTSVASFIIVIRIVTAADPIKPLGKNRRRRINPGFRFIIGRTVQYSRTE